MSIYEDSPDPERETPEGQFLAPEWTIRRRELLKWFKSEAPSLAPGYEAAVQLLSMPAMPARVHLISHLVRDLYAKLPEVLNGEYRFKTYAEEIKNSMRTVQAEWKDVPSAFGAESASSPGEVRSLDRVEIPTGAAQSVIDLIKTHDDLSKQTLPSEALAQVLYALYAEPRLAPPARLTASFRQERNWFVRRAHLTIDPKKMPNNEGLVEHFEAFESALYSLVGRWFEGQKEINDRLAKANQRTD